MRTVLIALATLPIVMAAFGLSGVAWFVMTPDIVRAIADAMTPTLRVVMALGSIAIVIAVTINRRDPG